MIGTLLHIISLSSVKTVLNVFSSQLLYFFLQRPAALSFKPKTTRCEVGNRRWLLHYCQKYLNGYLKQYSFIST